MIPCQICKRHLQIFNIVEHLSEFTHITEIAGRVAFGVACRFHSSFHTTFPSTVFSQNMMAVNLVIDLPNHLLQLFLLHIDTENASIPMYLPLRTGVFYEDRKFCNRLTFCIIAGLRYSFIQHHQLNHLANHHVPYQIQR